VSIPYSNSEGVPSFTISGTLPPGLAVSLQGLSVRISGRPTSPPSSAPTTYTFKVTLTDQAVCGPNQAHCAAGQDYTITVS
jgi:hypothetical protein